MSFRKGFAETDDRELPDHLFRWLEAVGRRTRRELEARVGDDLVVPGGRGSRLLGLIPEDGIRITDLAERARVTKQALGQLVNGLEADGLVESHDDPDDARVRMVRRTPEGDRITRTMEDRIAELEREFADQVGQRRYATMKAVLREIGAGEI